MIPRDDSRHTLEFDNYYIIRPDFRFFEHRFKNDNGKPVPEDFEYNSKTNTWWLTVEELREMVKSI
jgi:UDP-N-acetylglucosamine 4,6-dehydratase